MKTRDRQALSLKDLDEKSRTIDLWSWVSECTAVRRKRGTGFRCLRSTVVHGSGSSCDADFAGDDDVSGSVNSTIRPTVKPSRLSLDLASSLPGPTVLRDMAASTSSSGTQYFLLIVEIPDDFSGAETLPHLTRDETKARQRKRRSKDDSPHGLAAIIIPTLIVTFFHAATSVQRCCLFTRRLETAMNDMAQLNDLSRLALVGSPQWLVLRLCRDICDQKYTKV